MNSITKEDHLEYLIAKWPDSLNFLMRKGVCGIQCAELNKKSLEDIARDRGFTDSEINQLIIELNHLLKESISL